MELGQVPVGQVRAEDLEIRTGVHHGDGDVVRNGGPHDPGDERAAHHRHPRRPRGGQPDERVGPGRDREPVLEPVRGRQVRGPVHRQRTTEEGERVDSAEQDHLGPERPNGLVEASSDVGERPEEAFGLTVHGVPRGLVERVVSVGARTQDRDQIRRVAPYERLQRALDPAHAWRVVVGDQERPRNVHGGLSSQT
jgi:hypothetical protein